MDPNFNRRKYVSNRYLPKNLLPIAHQIYHNTRQFFSHTYVFTTCYHQNLLNTRRLQSVFPEHFGVENVPQKERTALLTGTLYVELNKQENRKMHAIRYHFHHERLWNVSR